MNRLKSEKRAEVIACLVRGNGIRATARITNVSGNTVKKLIKDLRVEELNKAPFVPKSRGEGHDPIWILTKVAVDLLERLEKCEKTGKSAFPIAAKGSVR